MILMKMFVMMCILFTFEMFAVAIARAFDSGVPRDTRKSLMGFSYIWMAIVYFTFPILFELFGMLIEPLNWYWIILINYVFGVVVITLLESGLGYMLEKLLGFCPWSKYTNIDRGIVFLGGYSRWDISLTFGLMTIAFYYFIKLFNYTMRWV